MATSNKKRSLQSVINPDDKFYIFGEIFDNEYAQDDWMILSNFLIWE